MSGTRRQRGRVGVHIEPFRECLLGAGYTPGTVRGMLKVMGHLGRWMDVNANDSDRLTNAEVEAFCRSLRTRPDRRIRRLRSIDQLVVFSAMLVCSNRQHSGRRHRSRSCWTGSGRG